MNIHILHKRAGIYLSIINYQPNGNNESIHDARIYIESFILFLFDSTSPNWSMAQWYRVINKSIPPEEVSPANQSEFLLQFS